MTESCESRVDQLEAEVATLSYKLKVTRVLLWRFLQLMHMEHYPNIELQRKMRSVSESMLKEGFDEEF